jgi:predicted esterase
MTDSSRDGTPAPEGQGPLPRILCLHGGGTSGKIFQIQTVRFQRLLKHRFRFVFVDAPFPSIPGPGVSPFFDEMGPFHRWLRRKPDETGEQVTARIENAIRGEGEGVTQGFGYRQGEEKGPVVGVLGFSQGGAIASGLLLNQQRQNERGETGYGLRFGVMCMGAAPPVLPTKGSVDQPIFSHSTFIDEWKHIIHLPTLHLHGLQDEFLVNIRKGMNYYKPGTTKLMEFDIEHRLPISEEHNQQVVQAIIDLYEQTKP